MAQPASSPVAVTELPELGPDETGEEPAHTGVGLQGLGHATYPDVDVVGCAILLHQLPCQGNVLQHRAQLTHRFGLRKSTKAPPGIVPCMGGGKRWLQVYPRIPTFPKHQDHTQRHVREGRTQKGFSRGYEPLENSEPLVQAKGTAGLLQDPPCLSLALLL